MKTAQLTWAAVLILVGQILVGEVSATASEVSNDQLLQRLQQLEQETQMLRAELGQVQSRPIPLPSVEPKVSTVSTLAAEGEVEYFTWDEIRAEMSDLAWKKGDFKIVPYGILWATSTYETSRTYLGDYTLWAISPDVEGEDAIHFNAKGTRLGLDVSGPRLHCFGCAKSGGKVEIDFEGSFTVENKPGVLLRHAYWEVKDQNFRFLMGQTWDVISPLYPKCILYSVYWGAGNIGYRRAQMRYERYFHLTPGWQLELQGALATDAGCDFTNGNAPANGDHGGWPIIEMRVGTKIGHHNPICFGVSGHVGEEIFDFGGADDTPRQTWSLNADIKVPITSRFGVQGEFFTGTNLKTFLGGAIQGVNVGGTGAAIRANGGWINAYYDLSPCWHCAVGYTLDDPVDADITTTAGRLYNQAYWGNVTYDVTKKFMLGLEVSQWKTLLVNQTPGESTRFEFAGKYAF